MGSETRELLAQGLWITAIGMGLVFAALGLLWAIVVLLTRSSTASKPAAGTSVQPSPDAQQDEELAAERARVAAIAASLLISSAVPLLLEAPAGPDFEHGRTAPSWVTTNRAITLEPWIPPRAESD